MPQHRLNNGPRKVHRPSRCRERASCRQRPLIAVGHIRSHCRRNCARAAATTRFTTSARICLCACVAMRCSTRNNGSTSTVSPRSTTPTNSCSASAATGLREGQQLGALESPAVKISVRIISGMLQNPLQDGEEWEKNPLRYQCLTVRGAVSLRPLQLNQWLSSRRRTWIFRRGNTGVTVARHPRRKIFLMRSDADSLNRQFLVVAQQHHLTG